MQAADADIQTRWWALQSRLTARFGKPPDLDALLYLIGIQEVQCFQEKISKEAKQDLMHVAVCTVLLPGGYYRLEKVDEEGWPHFEQLKPLPVLNPIEQESFLKEYILLYFDIQYAPQHEL